MLNEDLRAFEPGCAVLKRGRQSLPCDFDREQSAGPEIIKVDNHEAQSLVLGICHCRESLDGMLSPHCAKREVDDTS